MDQLDVIAQVLVIYLAAVVSPGPNFAVVSRLSLARSRFHGIAATFGIVLASTSYALLTLLGVSALLQAATWLELALRVGSGLLLVYLGSAAWMSRSAGTREAAAKTTAGGVPAVAGGAGSVPVIGRGALLPSLRTGLLVGLSNPKSLAFFAGLYAVAVPPGTPWWAKGAILGASFAIEVVWYSLVAVFLSTPRAQAAYKRWDTWIERAFGALLIAIGLSFVVRLFGPF